MSDECTCGIPEDAIILNELRVVEYMDSADGEIWKIDLSRGSDGEDLSMGKAFELAEWAKTLTIAPMIAEMVYGFINAEGDGEVEL